jgi:hypothetical protein
MKLGLSFVLATAVARGTTCTGNLTDPSLGQGPMRAQVRFVNVGGGCWVLSNRFGHRYEPMQLAEEFRQEGLQVLVTFRARADLGSVCMLRDVIEIEEIEVSPD